MLRSPGLCGAVAEDLSIVATFPFWKPGRHVRVPGHGGPGFIPLAATCRVPCSQVGFQFAKMVFLALISSGRRKDRGDGHSRGSG